MKMFLKTCLDVLRGFEMVTPSVSAPASAVGRALKRRKGSISRR